MVQEPDQCGSTGLVVPTGRWGDVVAPFQDPEEPSATQPDVLDLSFIVDTVKGTAGAIPKVRGRLFGDQAHPAVDVNVVEVAVVVDALKGLAFPFSGPEGCP